jgi:hypothetical protein
VSSRPSPGGRSGGGEYSRRMVGPHLRPPGWEDTKRRYWASRFTRKRCFWCRRKSGLQLNHLTYALSGPTGACPLWVVKPLCRTCHKVETWLARKVRPRLKRTVRVEPVVGTGRRRRRVADRRAQRWAHAYVTYAVRWSLNLAVWGVVLIAAVQI